MRVDYSFTRATVAEAIVKYLYFPYFPVPDVRPCHLLYAGKLIAKAKKERIIGTCNGKPNSRYYKFINTSKSNKL